MLLSAVLYLSCDSDEASPHALRYRIKAITVCCQTNGESSVYSLLYTAGSRPSEVWFNNNQLVKFHYSGEQLVAYDRQGTRFHLHYQDGKIATIERVVPGEVEGIPHNVYHKRYAHNGPGSFTRCDNDTINNANPQTIYEGKHEVSPDKQLSGFLCYTEADTLLNNLHQTSIVYDPDAPNPLLDWNFPVAFNEAPLVPFHLTTYNVLVGEIFYATSKLPSRIMRYSNGELWLTSTMEYRYEDGRLAEIEASFDDLVDRKMRIRTSLFEWETY